MLTITNHVITPLIVAVSIVCIWVIPISQSMRQWDIFISDYTEGPHRQTDRQTKISLDRLQTGPEIEPCIQKTMLLITPQAYNPLNIRPHRDGFTLHIQEKGKGLGKGDGIGEKGKED